MVYWSSYLVPISFLLVGLWATYHYWRWARVMDKINQDHHECQVRGCLSIEGIDYFVADLSWIIPTLATITENTTKVDTP